MKYSLLVLSLLSGCASVTEEELITSGISLKLISSNSMVAQLEMTNNARKALAYQHWFGQKGMPVAYCKDELLEIHVCSTKVFLIGDEYYTHETYIGPGETVAIEANVKSVKAIGIKFYFVEESYRPIYVWHEFK